MVKKNTLGAMLRGQHRSQTFGAGPVMGFSAKYRSRNPDLGGRIPTLLGVGRARTHWASHQTRLGEPVLIGRTRIGRAIKRGWGEPSNEVGRASTKGPLGEPLNFHSLHACFKACLAQCLECLLGTSTQTST